jgi:hypothetical protein
MIPRPAHHERLAERTPFGSGGVRLARIDTAPLTAAIRDAGPDKVIARETDCTDRTVRRWKTGQSLPDPIRLIRLMRFSGSVRRAYGQVLGLYDTALDAWEAKLTQDYHRLNAGSGRGEDGEAPDAQTVAPVGADPGRTVRRHG